MKRTPHLPIPICAGLVALFLFSLASAADPKIYFTDLGGNRVRSLNLDGTGLQTIYTNSAAIWTTGLAYDRALDYLYLSEYATASNARVQRIRPNGTGLSTLVTTTQSVVWHLALDDTDLFLNSTGANSVGRVQTSGLGLTWIGPANGGGEGIDVDPVTNRVYYQRFGSGYTEMQIAYNGVGGATVLIANSPFTPGIEVAHELGYVYWADPNSDRILRTDLNGGNSVVLATGSVLDAVYSLDVDPDRNQLYFSTSNGTIGRMNLDGTGIQSLATGLGVIYGLEVVPEPSSAVLLLGGLGLFAYRRRRG